MRPDRDIAGAEAAHRRLVATLDQLTDDDVRAPSRLPDWNVAMVLTHLARNADSFRRMFDGAQAGTILEQYERGAAGRRADIEAGRDRTRAFVVDDVRAACAQLEACWTAIADEIWASGRGRISTGEDTPVHALPFRRWREVVIHHRDLGLGYTEDDWPDDYVAIELERALAGVPDRLAAGDRRRWLAWLVGRTPPPDSAALGPWRP